MDKVCSKLGILFISSTSFDATVGLSYTFSKRSLLEQKSDLSNTNYGYRQSGSLSRRRSRRPSVSMNNEELEDLIAKTSKLKRNIESYDSEAESESETNESHESSDDAVLSQKESDETEPEQSDHSEKIDLSEADQDDGTDNTVTSYEIEQSELRHMQKKHAVLAKKTMSSKKSRSKSESDSESDEALLKSESDSSHDSETPPPEPSKCIFDDHLFGLTSEAKTELTTQLGQMAEQVNFVQRGGSHYCGKWNDDCHCKNGWVVYGSDTLQLWSSPAHQVPVDSPTGTIKCGVDMNLPKPFSDSIHDVFAECRCFGQYDDSPVPTRTDSKPFTMEKKLNSWSYLQESWIMLTRLLASHKMIPIGTGDRLYNGLHQWSRRGGTQSSVIEIGYINRFLEESAIKLGLSPYGSNVIGLINSYTNMTFNSNSTISESAERDESDSDSELDDEAESSDANNVNEDSGLSLLQEKSLPVPGVPVRTGLTCLEWGISYMTRMDKACVRKITVEYEQIANGNIPKPGKLDTMTHGNAKNILYSDIVDFPTVLQQPGNIVLIDVIIATQVWEHLPKPKESAVALFQSLKPGGVLIFTVPQLAQYHEVPGDFFRYTKEGIVLLMTEAGFCVPKSQMASGGDFVIDVGRSTGLQMEDFTSEELKNGYIRGYDKMSDGANTLMGLAFKPPFGVGAEECSGGGR